jgi:hypothetical protein
VPHGWLYTSARLRLPRARVGRTIGGLAAVSMAVLAVWGGLAYVREPQASAADDFGDSAAERQLLEVVGQLPDWAAPSVLCRPQISLLDWEAALALRPTSAPSFGPSVLSGPLIAVFKDSESAAVALQDLQAQVAQARELGYDEGGMSLVTPKSLQRESFVLLLPHDALPEQVARERRALMNLRIPSNERSKTAVVGEC